MDHFNDPSCFYRGSSDCNKLWCRDTAEWQWPEAERSLNGFAAEESTCITTSWDLQRWFLPQPSLCLRSMTPEPLLCCRSWSTSSIWWLMRWFAAHIVAEHRRSWGVGLQAGTWESLQGEADHILQCNLRLLFCLHYFLLGHRDASARYDTTLFWGLGRQKKKVRRTMWMSL